MFIYVRYDENKKKSDCFYGIDELYVEKQDIRFFDGETYWIYKLHLNKKGEHEKEIENVLDFEVY